MKTRKVGDVNSGGCRENLWNEDGLLQRSSPRGDELCIKIPRLGKSANLDDDLK